MAVTARFDSELGAFLEETGADLCRFECAVTVEAKNVGRIQGWPTTHAALDTARAIA